MGNCVCHQSALKTQSNSTLGNDNIEIISFNNKIPEISDSNNNNEPYIYPEPNNEQSAPLYIATFLPPPSSFEYHLFMEYNVIRTNPHAYSSKLKNMMEFIDEIKGKFYFNYPNNDKILLKTGKAIFQSTIDHLNSIRVMLPLQWNEEIKVDLPQSQDIISNDELTILLINKRKEVKHKFNQCMFNLDINSDPTLSAMFQITDETFSQNRRNNILNPFFKYCAITWKNDQQRKFISLSSFA